MLNFDNVSEPEPNFQYEAQSHTTPWLTTGPDDSENAPLPSHTRVTDKIISDNLEITFGNKSSTVIFNKINVASNTLTRKAPNPGER